MERPAAPARPIDVEANRTQLRNGALAVVLFLAVGAALSSSARGPDPRAAGAPPAPGTLVAAVRRAAPDPAAPVGAVAAGATNLGYRLEQITAEPGHNWVVSPWSMAEAFGMLR